MTVLVHMVTGVPGWTVKSASPLQHALATLSVQLLPALAGYLILVRWIERRRVDELAPADIPALGAAGLMGGALLLFWAGAGRYSVDNKMR